MRKILLATTCFIGFSALADMARADGACFFNKQGQECDGSGNPDPWVGCSAPQWAVNVVKKRGGDMWEKDPVSATDPIWEHAVCDKKHQTVLWHFAGEDEKLETPDKTPEDNNKAWKILTDEALKLSARQNHGKPVYVRQCEPERKICHAQIYYKDTDGNPSYAAEVYDLHDVIFERLVCRKNDTNDMRWCINFDTQVRYTDMKNANGDWVIVEGSDDPFLHPEKSK